MAPDATTNITPTPTPQAPTPDLGVLSQPGSAAPAAAASAPTVTPPAPGQPITSPAQLMVPNTPVDPHIQAANDAAAKFTQIAAQSTAPPPPGPHARLLSMVQGLALGLDSFGKAIATHGKEGGAEEVVQVQAQRQQQKIQAQQARDAAKDQQLQQQLKVIDTNMALATMAHNAATWPNEITEQGLRIAAGKQGLAINAADFAAAHGGMSADEFNSALAGTEPVGTKGTNPYFTSNANIQLAAATRVLGANDPYVQQLHNVLANPNATPKDLYSASVNVQNQLGAQEKATDAQIKKDSAFTNSTVGKLSTPTALADPGAQAAIQTAIDNPKTDPADIPTLRALIPQAALAQKNAEDIKAHEAMVQRDIDQGSSDDMGKLLANNDVTLPELKNKNLTPAFIAASIKAAKTYDPTFSATTRDAQARAAGSEANVQFFRNTDSLLVKNGTLDQLAAAYKNLGNTQLPALTTLENLRKEAVGSGPIAAARAAQLGVVDDYAKVMAGSGGSDSARDAAFKVLSLAQSPEQQDAAIAQLRAQIESQRNGQIGINPYLKSMFPDPATRQEVPGKAGTQPGQPANSTGIAKGNDGNWYYHDGAGKILGPAPTP